MYSPRAWSNPAARPAVCPKLRRSLTTVTRLSTAAISRSKGNVPSMEPSSTSTISNVSPLASITDLSRAYRSVTFSCSLWRGTTIEYLSTVFLIIRQRGAGFAMTYVGRHSRQGGSAQARPARCGKCTYNNCKYKVFHVEHFVLALLYV